ncbi:MAG: CHAD domain-containing protein [Nitrospira sp.]|nr:CHAD domain-containing protein [Nitrospira sp.]
MSAWYLNPIQRLQQAAQVPPVMELPLTINQLARHTFKKLCKAIRRLKASPSDAALHKIRILVKRARYAADLAR